MQTAAHAVDYLHALRYADLPPAVRHRTVDVIFDTLGCMLGGAQTDLGKAYARVTARVAGAGDSTAFGIARKVDAVSAAFVNAAHADALDYEDTLLGHPSAAIVPSALAVGEMLGACGEDVVTAIAGAYDVAVRIGVAITPTPERARDVAVRFAWFGFAAAAAAAKLLRLSVAQIRDAFGYAGASSPLPVWITKWPRPLHWIKNNLAEQARAGVLGALAARDGLGGPRDILESDLGFWRMVGSDRFDPAALHDGLGSRHMILETHFKPYPACRWLHTIIEATQRLYGEHRIGPPEIAEIRVGAPDETASWFVDPVPATLVDAEFSIPYVVAVTLHGIPPGPRWYAEETLRDPSILALAEKVSVHRASVVDHGAGSGGRLPCDVRIVLRDGRELAIEHADPLGSPERPLSDQALREKFIALATTVLGAARAAKAWDERSRFSELPDVRSWTAGLT
jgi:2-methylcitrate dehydratase PrpD